MRELSPQQQLQCTPQRDPRSTAQLSFCVDKQKLMADVTKTMLPPSTSISGLERIRILRIPDSAETIIKFKLTS